MIELADKKVFVFNNTEELSESVFKEWIKIGESCIRESGRFVTALSGGKTPIEFYRRLSRLKDWPVWEKTHIFLVDERFVPFDNPESNFRMIKDNFIGYVPIAESNIHPICIGDTLKDTTARYEDEIKKFFD